MGVQIDWPAESGPILVLPAQLSLTAARRRLASFEEDVAGQETVWIILRHASRGTGPVLHYAFEPRELMGWLEDSPLPAERPLADHLHLSDHPPSPVCQGHRRTEVEVNDGPMAPTRYRVIHLSRGGEVRAVGTWGSTSSALESSGPSAEAAGVEGDDALELGGFMGSSGSGSRSAPASPSSRPQPPRRPAAPRRGILGRTPSGPTRGGGAPTGRRRDAPEPAAPHPSSSRPRAPLESSGPSTPSDQDHASDFHAVLSADGPGELEMGQVDFIEFRIERAGADARPLAHSIPGHVKVGASESLRVLLSLRGRAIRVQGSRLREIEPPSPGGASVGEFEIEAVEPGEAEVALSFRQGGRELAAVRFGLEVLAPGDTADPARSRSEARAVPPEPADDAVLRLLIEEVIETVQQGDRTLRTTRFRYRLVSEPLGLHYLTLESRPLLNRDGEEARDLDDYVDWIYARATQELRRRSDLPRFQKELSGLGASLCNELLSPEVARTLWGLRDRIEGIQITSWEPRIPWELVRLRDPDSGELDDRYFAEYGLIRTFHGETPPRSLPLRDWRYLAATYPNGTEVSVQTEVEFLTRTLPEEGVEPQAIEAGFDSLWSVLEACDFDVLHLACHGIADPGDIRRAALVIGDRPGLTDGDQAEPILLDAETVRYGVRLRKRRPLVFLHACEAGRHGVGLTAWGGWPQTFMEAGAGAFIGASWPVRDRPASLFACAFYEALWEGRTLGEAAQRAREAAKPVGDASWLAFKVYGHPLARRA